MKLISDFFGDKLAQTYVSISFWTILFYVNYQITYLFLSLIS